MTKVTYKLPLNIAWKVEEYIAEDGTIPYRNWFDSLDVQAATKVATAVLRMEMGNTSNVKWFKGMGEYRIGWGPGYRIYLVRDGRTLIVLFNGGTKATQKADIKRAIRLKDEYKARKVRTRKRGETWH